ncbi:PTS mannose transporter subunit IIAB, partial [Listeria monocytogenes]|nr:PTS mannose transporter subunit IIAB [Listeria monocytogenes]
MKKLASEMKNHVLTGISYMIPLVIAGAVIMAISRVGGSIFGIVDIWD